MSEVVQVAEKSPDEGTVGRIDRWCGGNGGEVTGGEGLSSTHAWRTGTARGAGGEDCGRELSSPAKALAAGTIHWGFGVATGAAYGALAEYFPAATSKDGASFGLALAALTHENALPALGLSAEPAEQTQREHTSEMATHLVFGVVTETVRRFVRKML